MEFRDYYQVLGVPGRHGSDRGHPLPLGPLGQEGLCGLAPAALQRCLNHFGRYDAFIQKLGQLALPPDDAVLTHVLRDGFEPGAVWQRPRPGTNMSETRTVSLPTDIGPTAMQTTSRS